MLERYSEEFFHTLKNIDSQKWGLKKKTKAFVAIFEAVADNNKLCLCRMMAAEVEQLDEENRRLLHEYFIQTESWLTQLFTAYRSEINTSLSSKVLAKSLLSGLEGALLLDRVVGDKNRLKAHKELFLAIL